ncbi:MAG: elongation factor G [Acidobacteria bacterium]|nr:elongation factor G [Acidobacteriota bacterium]
MASIDLARVRNIGVIAHIDAGKTTVTERFLNNAGVTHKIGEVHDGEAVMDFRPDERERGITIAAAAISFDWDGHRFNLIDTPGHVDFTAEVERSLRVLDGAVVVFSGVEGVEPQSETVWHQADRYRVPRLAFVNKLDRVGADHDEVLRQIRTTLRAHAFFVNIPHGLEDKLDGVIDVIEGRWVIFDAKSRGRDFETREVPEELRDEVARRREELLAGTAECVEWLADKFLGDEPVSTDELKRAIREATIAGRMVPVLCGAALRDLGVRLVLDAVCDYLPSPGDVPAVIGAHPDTSAEEPRPPDPNGPFSAIVFKVVATQNTDFYWLRVYSGTLGREDRCYNPRTKTRLRLRQLVRLHADRTVPVEGCETGDIVAVPALKDVQTGDTLCDPDHPLLFESIAFPETVVSVAVEARTAADRDRLLDVVARLAKEDPTFRCRTDDETGQLILSGMGELHLDVLRNRMQREFNVDARFGRPRVSYRETVRGEGRGEGRFEKRIGDAVVWARAVAIVEPRPREAGDRVLAPVEIVLGGPILAFSEAVRAEISDIALSACGSGSIGYPVIDARVRVMELEIGETPDPRLPIGASLTMALRHAFEAAGTLLLEPIMRLEVRTPESTLGTVVKDLSSRRAEIRETAVHGEMTFVRGFAPLAEMFGYSTQLRSLTQGRGTFTLEPFDYAPSPDRGPNS